MGEGEELRESSSSGELQDRSIYHAVMVPLGGATATPVLKYLQRVPLAVLTAT